jgi:hypothetical protein
VVIGYRRFQVLSNSWWCDAWMSVDPEVEVAAATARQSSRRSSPAPSLAQRDTVSRRPFTGRDGSLYRHHMPSRPAGRRGRPWSALVTLVAAHRASIASTSLSVVARLSSWNHTS